MSTVSAIDTSETSSPVADRVSAVTLPRPRILLLGAGTVGSAFAQLLERRGLGAVASVLVRDTGRVRAGVPGDRLVGSPDAVKLGGVDACVEALGGVEPALSLARRVLAAGIPYVTANKELVAAHGEELLALASANGTSLHFEASVGAAVPCVRLLRDSLRGAGLRRLCGVLNGTSHFILDEWRRPGGSFDCALAEAQRRGYAEAQPDADLSGLDAARKLSVLHWLVAGRLLRPEEIARVALPTLRQSTVDGLAAAGFTVKPAACVSWQEDGTPDAWVAPAAVPVGKLLAATGGASAVLLAQTESGGDLLLTGPGAGGEATASALLDDLSDALAGRKQASLGPSIVPGAASEARSWVIHIPGGCGISASEVVQFANAGGALGWHFPSTDGGCVALVNGMPWRPGITEPLTRAGACVLEVLG